MGNYLIFFGIAYLFSWMLISLFRILGNRLHIVALSCKEDPYRQKNVPLLGGASLYFGFILTLILFLAWKPEDPEITIAIERNQILAIFSGASFVALAGLISDVYPLAWIIRVSFQILAAVLLVMAKVCTDLGFLQIGNLPLGQFSFDIGNTILTILWVLAVVNFMDLLERFAGLVVGLGIIAAMFLFAMGIWGQDYGTAFLCLVFAGNLISILWDELPPATIKSGKMGSGFTGFMLAALTLNLEYSHNHYLGACIPAILLLVPLVLGTAFLIRRLSGKSLSEAQLWSALQKKNIQFNNVLAGLFLATTVLGVIALIVFAVASSAVILTIIALLGISSVVFSVKLTRYKASL